MNVMVENPGATACGCRGARVKPELVPLQQPGLLCPTCVVTQIAPQRKGRLLLEAVSSGLSVTNAAKRAGMSRRSVFDWKAADPQFARELENAYEEGTDRLYDAALQRALLPGAEHDGLLIFLLRMRDPARFNRKMVDVQVSSGDTPITVNHTASRPHVIIVQTLPETADAGQAEPAVRSASE
jgi:hypothetical protein